VYVRGNKFTKPCTKITTEGGRKGWTAEGFSKTAVLPDLTREAVQYIGRRAAAAPRTPFFLYLPLNAPHMPVAPAPEFRGKSKAGDYGDYVVEVDWTVGEVLKALDQHRLAENTLVFFTSDNGPEKIAYPRIQEYHHYSMGSLRGLKRDRWEGGHRVPFLARWPGRIKPGSVSDEIICLVDLMATAAAVVGTALPATAGEDSYSILPALLGEKLPKPIREATVHHSGNGRFAIRRGQWVLIDSGDGDDNGEPAWFKKERGYKDDKQPGQLFDLGQDPAEHKNLYADHPEIVADLKRLLEKYKQDGCSAPRA